MREVECLQLIVATAQRHEVFQMGYTQFLELIAEAVKLLECRILREVERAELIELAVEFFQCRLFYSHQAL